MIFENEKVYKVLKKIFTYVFPALLYLWENIAKIWDIPYGTAIGSTIFTVWVAYGIFLGISKYKYHKQIEEEENYEM